ncbi:hypothetical protein ES703_67143 [subsurface metagenome]
MQVDAVARAAEGQLQAVMHQPLAVSARTSADLVEQTHGAFLEQAGADAAEHIVAGLPLQDHIVDAVEVQQLPEQQAGRAGADDGHLGAQFPSPRSRTRLTPRRVVRLQ